MPQFLPAFHLPAIAWTLTLLALLLLFLQNVSLPLILGQKWARTQLLFHVTPMGLPPSGGGVEGAKGPRGGVSPPPWDQVAER